MARCWARKRNRFRRLLRAPVRCRDKAILSSGRARFRPGTVSAKPGFPAAGQDYNHDLLTAVTSLHAGPLPATTRLAGVEPADVILSALKPHGNPLHPAGQPDPPISEQLKQLTTLHENGSLDDAEFSAAKRKLLGI